MPTSDKVTGRTGNQFPTLASRFPVWLLAALLLLATLALYWPATRCDFINFDDPDYVTKNVHIQNGFTFDSIKWVFCHPVSCNWHPLTMLSHMLDCQLYGVKPWGHHLTSVLLHALNGVLVFVLLRQMTGAVWRSFFVAALFVVHPLRVESVAWIAERKDLLSGCFGLLTLISYVRYAQKRTVLEAAPASGAKRQRAMTVSRWPAPWDYGLALLLFALGLMSKPMLVTWPFVMLLLDYWPLRRFQPGRTWRLVREKMPFFGLTIIACVVTFTVQQHGGATAEGEKIPFGARGGNALISCCRYLGKLFWPANLANPYPYPGHWPMAEVVLAGGVILGISVLLFAQRRQFPFLLMGWLWFSGMLVPVIGLVQVGSQAMADRYSYLPSLGVLILAVWGGYELVRRWRYALAAGSATALMAVALFFALTRQQLGYWRNSETLFTHALTVTRDNYLAYNNLGTALNDQGHTDAAIREFQEAIRLKPDYSAAYNNLGAVFARNGQAEQAIAQYQEAVRRQPGNVTSRFNLGTVLYLKGQDLAAIEQFQEVLRRQPNYPEAHYNLGTVLAQEGRIDEAISHFNEAVRLRPEDAEAHYSVALALAHKGQTDAAIDQYQEAIRLKPDYAEAYNNLGAALGRMGLIDAAIHQFQAAISLQPDYVQARVNLAQAIGMKNTSADREDQKEESKGVEK